MEIFAYVLAVIIGISLGLIGGGGSILTVPVLVYMLHIDPLMATTYSLFIVGITSLVGGAKAYTKKLIDFRAVALFGIPSILSIFIARHFLLPAIPDYLFDLGNIAITKNVLLMVVFALLMFGAAISMIRNEFNAEKPGSLPVRNEPGNHPEFVKHDTQGLTESKEAGNHDQPNTYSPEILAITGEAENIHDFDRDEPNSVPVTGRPENILDSERHEAKLVPVIGRPPEIHEFDRHEPNLVLVLPGLFIGLVTGLLGAGGGFLIIPTLVLIIRMPMKIAVGTSLLIVAINSLFGFVFSISITRQQFNWSLLLIFSLLAVVGIIIGSKLSDRITAETLKKAFGWFILVMGVYILIRELWL